MNTTFNLKRFFLLEKYKSKKPENTCYGVQVSFWGFVFSYDV